MDLNQIVNLTTYPILATLPFVPPAAKTYEDHGILVMPQFSSTSQQFEAIQARAAKTRTRFFATRQNTTVYLSPQDPDLPPTTRRNRLVLLQRAAITMILMPQQIPRSDTFYNDASNFRGFCARSWARPALLMTYADPLSSINLHLPNGRNSVACSDNFPSFAITLEWFSPPNAAVSLKLCKCRS